MTQAEIEKEVNTLGVKIVMNKKSFGVLHQYIQNDEKIIHVLDGTSTLGVLTNTRLITISATIFSAPDMKEVRLDKISNIKADLGMLSSELYITSVVEVFRLSHSKRAFITEFQTKLSQAIADLSKPIQQSPQVDIASQLEKLAKLKDQGILTEEEFKEQKMKLLA